MVREKYLRYIANVFGTTNDDRIYSGKEFFYSLNDLQHLSRKALFGTCMGLVQAYRAE
jgi:hypothetical protein